MTPLAYAVNGESKSYYVFMVNDKGYFNNSATGASSAWLVRPTVYLKSNVQILSGEGSSTDPYVLG